MKSNPKLKKKRIQRGKNYKWQLIIILEINFNFSIQTVIIIHEFIIYQILIQTNSCRKRVLLTDDWREMVDIVNRCQEPHFYTWLSSSWARSHQLLQSSIHPEAKLLWRLALKGRHCKKTYFISRGKNMQKAAGKTEHCHIFSVFVLLSDL